MHFSESFERYHLKDGTKMTIKINSPETLKENNLIVTSRV